MKKIVTLLLSVFTMLCLGVALVGCGGGGDKNKDCTVHTWEVSTNPTYEVIGSLKCKDCEASHEIPALKDIENWTNDSIKDEFKITYRVDGQRFFFTHSYFVFEDVDADTVALKAILGVGDDEFGIQRISIPKEYNGKTVTKISASAFDNVKESQLLSVSIPYTVVEIEEPLLAGLNWGSSTWIAGIGSVNTTVEFPLHFTMRDLFGNSIPSEITEVVFNGGDTIKTETLQGSCVSVYNIPNTVTKIEENAFIDCADQSGIQVKYAGTIAEWCNIDFENEYSNPFFRRDSSSFCLLDENNNYIGVNEITIPNTVTEIKKYAFAGFPAYTINIPDSVLKIGDYSFYKSKITAIEIPNSVVELGAKSFSWCFDAMTVVLGNGVTTVGEDPFDYTHSVQNLYYLGTAAQLEILKYNENITYNDKVLWRSSTVPAHIYSETVDLNSWSLGTSIWRYDDNGYPKVWNIERQDYYFGDDKYTYQSTVVEISDEAWNELVSKKGTSELNELLNNHAEIIAAFNDSSSKEEFKIKAEVVFNSANENFEIQFGKTGVIDHFTDSRTNNKYNFKAFSVEGVFGAYSYDEYELYLTEETEGSISIVSDNYIMTVTHILAK